MNLLSKYLVEAIFNELQSSTVVLLPGGFKPPHAGHLDLAKKYASLPNVSEVKVLVGPKERDGITREQSMAVWNLLLEGASNIVIESVSDNNPMRAAYKYIETAAPGTYAMGASSKGEDYARIQEFVKLHAPGAKYYRPGVEVVELSVDAAPLIYEGRADDANGKGVSASTLRTDLATNNYSNFKTNYPNISVATTKAIFNILTKRLQEGKLRAFDFDDTLVKTDAKVFITKGSGEKITMTPGDYATYKPEPGDKFDFSDFESPIRNAVELKKYTDIMRKVLSSPDRDRRTVVLTARANPKVVYDFLMKLGIRVPVIAVGSSDPIKKAEWIEKQIAAGYEDIYFLDDSAKNIKAVQTLKAKYPNIKLKTQLVLQEPALSETRMLTEGGAAGHMTHPYEDMDMTFKDVEEMIDAALSGKVEFAQEKLDGQNLMVTYKDGQVRAARNKGHLKNAGETSLTLKQMEDMFSGRGAIQTAFTEAMSDMQAAIERLTPQQKDEFFDNGKKFVNFEVLYPETANVVAYGAAQLRLHNITEYDENGNVVDTDTNLVKQLDSAIRQVESQNQKTYEIRVTDPIALTKTKDYDKQKQELSKDLKDIKTKFGLKDSDTLATYLQRWWERFIKSNAKGYGYDIPAQTLDLLINRWAFSDKATNIRMVQNAINNEDFKTWVGSFDKGDLATQKKIAAKPLETMFLKLGVNVLKNVSQLVSLNPDDSVRKIRTDLDTAIAQIKQAAASKDMQDDDMSLKFLKRELEKLKDIGGFEAIVPLEGIVFKYGGKLYKLTGAFAPINQIIGYLKFSR